MIAVRILVIGNVYHNQWIHNDVCFDKIYARGNCSTRWETRESISAVVMFPDARNTQRIPICNHMNPNVKATVRRNSVPQAMTDISWGIKNLTRNDALKKTMIPIPLSNQNEINDQVFAVFSALSSFFAHIFCQTRIEIAIERPSAGMIINCNTFEPAP